MVQKSEHEISERKKKIITIIIFLILVSVSVWKLSYEVIFTGAIIISLYFIIVNFIRNKSEGIEGYSKFYFSFYILALVWLSAIISSIIKYISGV